MSNQIEHRHLRYFLAVAEELHFRKAAEKLFISQPGLSRQIKQMEQDLGVTLFERNNRRVALTKTGDYLQKELQINLKNLEDILAHSKLIHHGKEGHLTLGFVGSAMLQIIPAILKQFNSKFPKVMFKLEEMDNQKQIEGLLSQEIDVGFVRLERVPRSLEIHTVLKETFCLVLPKNHPVNKRNFKNLSQFKDSPFILFDPEYSASYYEKVMQIFDGCGFAPIISHNTIHASSIYKLVENNLGVSIVPKSLQFGYDMNVKFIELDAIPQRAFLSIAWSKNNRNPMLQNILQLINPPIEPLLKNVRAAKI
ncbi:MAG: LysR family transcriptional regulator [Flavobacteriaceae bacterium]|jgi:DNA-binding transcriptional LysR family regulator|nr:LysR family transcriptional regulator [Flavobacteriaceae bacterium]MBT5920989.1 LysR family transcriptional regulator [Flavobacteriaceae bacterium]MDG1044439.1 LysR family transcriptional regulator [Flavobacteriaceae bacterium]MDO7544492.1 LysR family transcriptional regulator [Flavobacteriaceae bacterium]MDP5024332.1 LysR family transcriptional regulator [Flavobacteriaceae bacterium]